jgi:hypothetical protein
MVIATRGSARSAPTLAAHGTVQIEMVEPSQIAQRHDPGGSVAGGAGQLQDRLLLQQLGGDRFGHRVGSCCHDPAPSANR